MIVPAQREQHERVMAARARMAMPRRVAASQDFITHETAPPLLALVRPAPRFGILRRRWRDLANGLPILIRKDRSLTKACVRELWRSHLTWPDIVSARRLKPYVQSRYRLLRIVKDERPQLSLLALGRLFGGKNHATVLHALRKTAGQQA